MKILVAMVVLSFQIVPLAHASPSYRCEGLFKEKIERLNRTAKARRFIKRSAGIATAIGTAILIAPTFGLASPVGYGVLTLFPGLMPGLVGSIAVDSIWREDGIRVSFEAQEIMHLSEAQIRSELEKQRAVHAAERLKVFDQEVLNPGFAEKIINRGKELRKAAGLPEGTDADALSSYRDHFERRLLNQKIRIQNAISESLRLAKQKRPKETEKLTYDDWRNMLIKNQDLFCADNKVRMLRHVSLKIIRQEY